MTATKKEGRSLGEYERAKRRAACAACSLPETIRAQIRTASDRRIKQSTVIEWLKEEHGLTISRAEFTSHGSGHHDQWDEEESG